MLRTLTSICALSFSFMLAAPTHAMDGQLDPSFASAGVLYPDFSYLSSQILGQRMTAVTQDEQGRLLGVGHFLRNSSGGDYDCSVVRLNASGAYDGSFLPPAGFGPIALDLGGALTDFCSSIVALGNGNVAIAGESKTGTTTTTGVLLMLNSSGGRVSSFFSNGLFRANTDIALFAQQSITTSSFSKVVTDDSGRILAIGDFVTSAGINRGFVVRFLSTGQLDSSFGIDGLVIIPDSNIDLASANSLVVKGNRLLLAYTRRPIGGSLEGEVIRMQNNGALDPSFGFGTGRVSVPSCSYFNALALDPENKIVLACVTSSNPTRYGITRLDSAGALDQSFGNAGFVELRAPTSVQEVSSIDDLVVQSDGKIIATGDLRNNGAFAQGLNGEFDIIVGRFNSNGTRDTSFGYLNGQSDFRFGNPQGTMTEAVNESVSRLFLDLQGRVVVVGRRSLPNSTTGFGNQQVIARLSGTAPELMFRDGFE
jgi:uncharacterized delta-60 repeat protein